MAGEIYIADKTTLDLVKTQTDAIKAETSLIKVDTNAIKSILSGTYSDNLTTQTTNQANLIISLTGKYELLGFVVTMVGLVTIQIDGATNRKTLPGTSLPVGFTNLAGLGFKCNTSFSIYSSADIGSVKVLYRLLP